MNAPSYKSRYFSPEYNELFAVVASPEKHGAVVIGTSGIGKTSLLEAVLAHPDSPSPVMRLYCSPSLADVPYGILSPYLGTMLRMERPVEILREVNKVLDAESTVDETPLIVLEDAHHLDGESAFVLSLLVENAAVKLIAIATGALEIGSPLGTLADSQMLSTIVVQPLDLEGVRAVSEELIGGRLSDGTTRVIRALSGGNASFVKAYVRSCLEQGTLFCDESLTHENAYEPPVWILARRLPEIDNRLSDLVQEIHKLTPLEERSTLELLALGGPMPTSLLSACGFPYRRLLDSGELRSTDDSIIRMNSELHEAVLRQIISPQRMSGLFAQWNQTRQEMGLILTPVQALWALEIGSSPEPDVILQSVERATDKLDFELAWKLCTVSKIGEESEYGVLLEARVLMGMGRYYSARSILVRLVEESADQSHLLQAFNQLLLILIILGGRPQEGQTIEQFWERRRRHLENSGSANELSKGRRMADQLLGYWNDLNTPGAERPSIAILEEFLNEPDMVPEARVIVLSILSDLHSVEGRCEQALALAREALVGLQQHPLLEGTYQSKIIFRVGWNLIFAGRYSEAQDFIDASQGLSSLLIVHRQGMIALLRGLKNLLQGRSGHAIIELAEAVMELRLRDPAQLLPLAYYLYGWVILRSGGAAKTTGSQEHLGGSVLNKLLGEGNAVGTKPSSQRLLARAIASGIGMSMGGEDVGDFPLIEREVLFFDTAQLDDEKLGGHPSQKRLAKVLESHEGPRAGFLSRLVLVREQDIPGVLEELGGDALAQGEYQVGTEALTRAALRYSAVGEQRRCGAILSKVGGVIDEHKLAAGKHVERALALTELTSREDEIVELARSGLNNAEIARELTVSQRTVEGHLYRVFSKLGISERSQLKGIGIQPGTGSN